jgi:hypothetical protein
MLPPHVIVPLLGRFKGELGLRYHLTPLASVSASGINVRLWVTRLIALRDHDQHFHGPAFCDARGRLLAAQDIELDLLDRLQRIQESQPSLIPASACVYDSYGISRSFRRGATSEACATGVSPEDIDLINRWRTFEHGKGRRPCQVMRDHYSDIRLLIPALLRFSQAL